MIESFPSYPVRIFAANVLPGVPLTYIVPLGSYVELTGVTIVTTSAVEGETGPAVLTVAGVAAAAFTVGGGPYDTFFYSVFPPIIATDADTIEISSLTTSVEFDFHLVGRITAKRGPIT